MAGSQEEFVVGDVLVSATPATPYWVEIEDEAIVALLEREVSIVF
jgi:hypothetical protein